MPQIQSLLLRIKVVLTSRLGLVLRSGHIKAVLTRVIQLLKEILNKEIASGVASTSTLVATPTKREISSIHSLCIEHPVRVSIRARARISLCIEHPVGPTSRAPHKPPSIIWFLPFWHVRKSTGLRLGLGLGLGLELELGLASVFGSVHLRGQAGGGTESECAPTRWVLGAPV